MHRKLVKGGVHTVQVTFTDRKMIIPASNSFLEFDCNFEKQYYFTVVCLLQKASWLQFLFEKLVIAMVIYFVVSIVNSLAQNYHRRLYSNKVNPADKKLAVSGSSKTLMQAGS